MGEGSRAHCEDHKTVVDCLSRIKKAVAVNEAINERRDKLLEEMRQDIKQINEKIDTHGQRFVPVETYLNQHEKTEVKFGETRARIEEVNDANKLYTLKLLGVGLTLAGVTFTVIQLIITGGW